MLAIVALSSSAYAQGLIGFANNPVTAGIKDASGVNAAAGSAMVGLYWSAETSADLDSLTLGGTAPLALAGTFNNGGAPLALGASAGTMVLVEIRAWDNLAASSYEEALALGVGNAGRSGALNIMTLSAPPSSPANLVIQGGFRGFQMSQVPEPSTIALGILGGLGAMVLLRRRK